MNSFLPSLVPRCRPECRPFYTRAYAHPLNRMRDRKKKGTHAVKRVRVWACVWDPGTRLISPSHGTCMCRPRPLRCDHTHCFDDVISMATSKLQGRFEKRSKAEANRVQGEASTGVTSEHCTKMSLQSKVTLHVARRRVMMLSTLAPRLQADGEDG